jgi:hypothetical protein
VRYTSGVRGGNGVDSMINGMLGTGSQYKRKCSKSGGTDAEREEIVEMA